jgi:hypothetical protein
VSTQTIQQTEAEAIARDFTDLMRRWAREVWRYEDTTADNVAEMYVAAHGDLLRAVAEAARSWPRPAPTSEREQWIENIRQLADWLEANPQAPLGPFDRCTIQHNPMRGGTIANRAAARRVADSIEVLDERSDDAHGVTARRTFGRAEYVVFA